MTSDHFLDNVVHCHLDIDVDGIHPLCLLLIWHTGSTRVISGDIPNLVQLTVITVTYKRPQWVTFPIFRRDKNMNFVWLSI